MSQYNGRWLSALNQQWMEASFGGNGHLLKAKTFSDVNAGSSLDFTVSNTTDVILILSHSPYGRRPAEHNIHDFNEPTLALTPARRRSERVGPVDLFVALNGTKSTFHKRASGLDILAAGLDLHSRHRFVVTLPVSKEPGTVQVSGILMDSGGLLLPQTIDIGQQLQTHSKTDNNDTITPPPFSINEGSTTRKLVEIVAPAPMLTGYCSQNNSNEQYCSGPPYWPQLVDAYFTSTSLSLLPVSPDTCMTRQCQGHQIPASTTVASAQEIFFRAGAPGTPLYDRLWPFGSNKGTPAALILMLGLADVEAFLATNPATKHQATQFTDDFARAYSSFIQTIRRTAYSPTSMVQRQSFEQIALQDEIDESYLYNSSPSSIPIFLVLQPIPTVLLHPQSRQMKSILYHAASKVLNELKWHIGDKHTFIIDTDGWLNDSDFLPSADNEQNHVEFSLTQPGHIKFAHHISLHLCHYVLERDASSSVCPFDRHEEYTGNLYVPEAAGVGKVMEEKKIARVKEIFGVE